jgi:hypothetical protein
MLTNQCYLMKNWKKAQQHQVFKHQHQHHQEKVDEVEIEEVLGEAELVNEENNNNAEDEQQHLINYATN